MHTIVYEPRLFLSTRRGKDTLHIIDIIITIDIIDIIDYIPGHVNLFTLLNFGEADSWSRIYKDKCYLLDVCDRCFIRVFPIGGFASFHGVGGNEYSDDHSQGNKVYLQKQEKNQSSQPRGCNTSSYAVWLF